MDLPAGLRGVCRDYRRGGALAFLLPRSYLDRRRAERELRLLAELRKRGIRCRLYVPFALSWEMAIQYLRRRLDEYPAMMWLVTKNLFRRG